MKKSLALPLGIRVERIAVAILLVLNTLLSPPFSLLLAGVAASYDENATIGPIIDFGCAICAALQVLIARRLRYVAARPG